MKKITVFTLIFCLSIGMFFGYGKTSKAKESVKGTCGATQDIDMVHRYRLIKSTNTHKIKINKSKGLFMAESF